MTFIDQYNRMKNVFNLENDIIKIADTSLDIANFSFSSSPAVIPDFTGRNRDYEIKENCTFRYPVITPGTSQKYNQAIVLLHGLNERTWFKHLSGARLLAEQTGRPVILFPLSFHINRGLPEWADVRIMSNYLPARRSHKNIREVSVANIALSERLTEHPERFFTSGLRSGMDLLQLLKDIKSGSHPLFLKGSSYDIFAYSVSCTLIQTLMIINPDNLLSGSKIVLFAGGSLFERVNGVSKYIIDSMAFETIIDFYKAIMNDKNPNDSGFSGWFLENIYGKAFKAVFSDTEYRNSRIRAVDTFFDNLMVIALKEDKVIPVDGIIQATGHKFSHSDHFRIVHFPYPYTHENPFPVNNTRNEQEVGEAFSSVYETASRFYTN